MPPDVAEARRKLAHEFSGGVLLPPPEPAALGVTNPADVAWVKEKMTPHPVSTLEDALNLKSPVGNGLPITYIAVRPYFAPAATSRAFAKKQKGWRYLELDAGHDAMVTSPETLTELLATI